MYLTGVIWSAILILEVLKNNLSIRFGIVNVLLILMYIFVLTRVNNKNILLIGLICIECTFSGWAVNKDTRFTSFSSILSVNHAETQAINELTRDHSFYRIGTTSQISTNDPMTYNFNGLSGYLSQQPTDMISYLAYLGYFQRYSWYRWSQFNNGSTVAVDSLLNLKYVLGANNKVNKLTRDINSFPTMNSQKSVNHYKMIGKKSGFTLYHNEHTFPMIMKTDKLVRTYKYSPEENIFKNLNNQFLSFNSNKLYVPVNGINNKYIGRKEKNQFSAIAQHNGYVYIYIPRTQSDKLNNIEIKANNKKITYAGDNINGENGILCLGYLKKSSVIKVNFSSYNKNYYKILCYQEKQHVLEKISSQLKLEYRSKFNNVHETNGKIEFLTNLKSKEYVTFPFYYQNGWTMYLNGKKYNGITKNFGALLAAKLPKGQNNVKIVYEIPQLKISIVISLISLLISISWLFKNKFKNILAIIRHSTIR